MIGLGWEVVEENSLDLDASIFMLGYNKKLPQDEFFIFYNNLRSPDGSVEHTGDNRSGEGEGDDELILADLNSIDRKVNEIPVVVSIHDAIARGHHFGLLKDAYIRVYDVENNKEILRYDLDESNPQNTDVEFGKLVRDSNDWRFIASGIGSNQGLQGYIDKYA